MSTLALDTTSHCAAMALVSGPVDSASKIWLMATLSAIYMYIHGQVNSRSSDAFSSWCVMYDFENGTAGSEVPFSSRQ